MGFSDNLRNVRKRKDMSQQKLAVKAGLSQTAIYQLEKGTRKPKIETIQKLASALNIPITELIDQTTLDLTDDLISLFANSSIQDAGSSAPDSVQEHYLISKFRDLNEKGQKKATDYVDDLIQIPEYRKDDQPPTPDN